MLGTCSHPVGGLAGAGTVAACAVFPEAYRPGIQRAAPEIARVIDDTNCSVGIRRIDADVAGSSLG
jgi:hypothetical protein